MDGNMDIEMMVQSAEDAKVHLYKHFIPVKVQRLIRFTTVKLLNGFPEFYV